MNVTYVFLVILGLVYGINCNSVDNTTEYSDESDNSTEVSTEIFHLDVDAVQIGIRGLYGGSYYNAEADNPYDIHYIHGTYQRPSQDYYKWQKYFRDNGTDETFDYYLGFGLSKMTDENFQYDDFHYYYHDLNRTIGTNESISGEFVIDCHPNATTLCPENTETICLLNGTIYCMSKISVVVPCPQNQSISCVDSVVPCVKACIEVNGRFEGISLPCLSTVVIIDPYEDNKGKTLNRVGGTFVIVDALKESERTFCVTVIVDPKPK